jgi:UDP-N-acetylglucosamine/UDP-N-acetylgalactosamine diphosphorylase
VAKAEAAEQGHVFEGWEELSPEEQKLFLRQVEGIDFQLLKRLIQQHVHALAGPVEKRLLQPAPITPLPSPELQSEEYEACRSLGEHALRGGELLIVTAAGGGGGMGPFSEPVGVLPVGPVTGKSVFQLHAEKILALNKRYRISLPWKIFCHPAELDQVADFFKSHGFFGLDSAQVSLSAQSLLPIVDRRGKILMVGPGRMAMAPSGHGAILLQMLETEKLEALEAQGIRQIFFFQVDNPLVRIPDVVFLGVHLERQAEMSSKAVAKTDPEERVGVFCQYNGSVGVTEYTELSPEDQEARLPDGSLAFGAANMGVHILAVDFLRRLKDEGVQLPFHSVQLATPCVNKRGKVVRPAQPNGIQFKAFAFDACALARRVVVTQVKREEEFSPIKNPSGPCSPLTAQQDLSRLFASWIRKACPALAPELEAAIAEAVEIPPLLALTGEELQGKVEAALRAGHILVGGGALAAPRGP